MASGPGRDTGVIQRSRLVIRGAVQGVGFRPFVHRLATRLALAGWVRNGTDGVIIEIEGAEQAIDTFVRCLETEQPPHASIQSFERSLLDPRHLQGFEIRESTDEGAPGTIVLPDIATCGDCMAEVRDPANRRYRYPFTNCTNCGPRYSIIERMPYDRARTAMARFTMCPDCRREYEDPGDRRFHAQPNACPSCGPQLVLWDARGRELARRDAALRKAEDAVKAGSCVAVKGLGGFHLIVDARNESAVTELRRRKRRDEKPFALMFPDLTAVELACDVSAREARLLASSESPIVLLRRRLDGRAPIAASVAPGNPTLGVMLPYTPLHQLLLADLGMPLVATSGNLSDEPICIDEREALDRLDGIADLLLVHDRPIVRHVDDSIVRIVLDRELVLRRARGYAPLPLVLEHPVPPVLAMGAHLKASVALTSGRHLFVSQHVGDLETTEALEAHRRTSESLQSLLDVTPDVVACDQHADYASTRAAQESGLPVVAVQHHHAHVVACMLENDLRGPALGIAWDGTGYGPDGTVWGGEFLRVDDRGFKRVATFRPFRLPGGEQAVREPRRAALGLLHELTGGHLDGLDHLATLASFDAQERRVLLRALERGLNAPITTSAGRLFDAVASLIGVRQRNAYEGQAAMALEFLVAENLDASYPFEIQDRREISGAWDAVPLRVVDWAPLVRDLIEDLQRREAPAIIATKVHNTLAAVSVEIARLIGESRVVLTGGCFQNRRLTERAVARLRAAGFSPYWHQRIPPNDGGIAVGQAAVAAMRQAEP